MNNDSHTKIGPFSIDIRPKKEILKNISENIASKTPTHIITLNSLMFNEALNNIKLRTAIEKAGIVVPESAGIKIANYLLNGIKTQKFPGIDFIYDICSLCLKDSYSIYLLGSYGNTSKIAAERLKNKFPGLKIAGASDGYFFSSKEKENAVVEHIVSVKPDVLLAGLNVPLQEIWISQNIQKLNVPIIMGVGGSFDVISGRLKRAPVILQKLGLEWFFRLIQEPSRFFRMLGLPIFALNVLKLKLGIQSPGTSHQQEQEKSKDQNSFLV